MLSWILFAVAISTLISALVLFDGWWAARHDDDEELPEGWPDHEREPGDEYEAEPDEPVQKYDKFPMPRRAGELGKVDDPPF